ncbi:MAG TPA: gamma-glutamyltransferase [Longimicrobiaceae bacterium]|nr:gamma-glutamyltransferase [Longimicrobiaceae bacterium]
MHKSSLIAIIVLAAACTPNLPAPTSSAADPHPATVTYAPQNRPDVAGTTGAVVAGHPLAAAAGYDVLRSGGNAVDAAVTMAAVLAVVRPHMNGAGGDAFALMYDGETGEVTGINGSGRSGALATADYFAARDLDEVPGGGALSITVPGAVSAWASALERHGTISLAQALQPAIHYAKDGFPVSTRLHDDIAGSADKLNAAGMAIFAPGGEAPRVGSLLRNPALAATLRTIASEGPGAMYGGAIGNQLAEFIEGQGGYLRVADFAAHEPEWTTPLSTIYEGKRVYAMPPNSQGIAQLSQMGMAEHFDLEAMGHNSADYLHTLIEIKKLAFADRDRWVADPAFGAAPLDRLLDADYLEARALLVGDRAAENVEPGLDESSVSSIGNGEGDTVYAMAVDRWGNAVSWIQSLFSSFGSGLVEPETGIVLQNRGSLFTLETGHPNIMAPGKRPYHTLTPVLVTDRDGDLVMTLGTPGGDSQTQSLLQVFNNLYLFGMTPQQAIEAPRYRSYNGLRVAVESRLPVPIRRELESRGHDIRVIDGWTSTFGGVQMILVDSISGALRTGADPRREAYGIAY